MFRLRNHHIIQDIFFVKGRILFFKNLKLNHIPNLSNQLSGEFSTFISATKSLCRREKTDLNVLFTTHQKEIYSTNSERPLDNQGKVLDPFCLYIINDAGLKKVRLAAKRLINFKKQYIFHLHK